MTRLFSVKKKKWYAYSIPRTGERDVAETWGECEKKVKGVKGALFKAFDSKSDALQWLSSLGKSKSLRTHGWYAYLIQSADSGVVNSWEECKEKIDGKKNAKYKKFNSLEAAKSWIFAGAPKEDTFEAQAGIYFDAGTGRGEGVEVSVTDEKGKNLLHKVLPAHEINLHGKKRLAADATNNLGELLAMKYALEIASRENIKKIFGDSKLVIEYWSLGKISRDVAAQTARTALEVAKMRKSYEQSGGEIARVAGKHNPADLGFHR